MLKNLKSLFFVETPEATQKNRPSKVPKKKVTSNNDITKKRALNVSYANETVDSKIVEKLLKAIEKNNLEGFDYLEFKKSIKALEKIPMDEATKYKSAFATASTMGVTLEKLLESVNYYIGILDKENEIFLNAFKGEKQDRIAKREEEVNQLENLIKEKSNQVKILTQEIEMHKNKITDLQLELNESKNRIHKTQKDFKVSFEHLKSQLVSDINKINDYLK